MATTTATIDITSDDLLSDGQILSLNASMGLYKGGTSETGLDQFRMERFKIATGTQFDLIEATTAASEDANYVYLVNKNTDETNYVIVSLYDVVLGRLYAKDWMFVPYNASDGDAEIEVKALNGINKIEYAMFKTAWTLPAAES